MSRAILYARVSTDKQEKERTIDSQLEELRRQVARNDDTLVKEYIDDGYSGKYLDRPALEQMREDTKTDTFDTVYFLASDRIARKSVHQDIIIGELLRYKKRIIINDRNYEENPENKFALTVFGAVAELERAKILERMRRGWLHRLRMGQLTSHGHIIFGYTYVRKTETSPPAYAINEKEAEIIRYIFESYASSSLGVCQLSRKLEQRGVITRRGRSVWKSDVLRRMLSNTTYMGIRYFNSRYREQETSLDGRQKKNWKVLYRDPSEWIAVKVPAIVSKELFDKAQERLKAAQEKYRRPKVSFLLSSLVKCGECGHAYCSCRWYERRKLPSGKMYINHWSAYRCNTLFSLSQRDLTKAKRCRNARISTHILEAKVMDLIKGYLFDPTKLLLCMDRGDRKADTSHTRELARIARRIKTLGTKRRRLIERHAEGRIAAQKYIAENRLIDAQLKRFAHEKTELVNVTHKREGISDASIKRFSINACTQFEACTDFDATKAFLQTYIQKIIFTRGKVAVIGSIPTQDAEDTTALPFRIEGEIDNKRTRIYAKPARTQTRVELMSSTQERA